MADWLEAEIKVNGELAEAVAEVFGRFAPNGVLTEQGVEFLDDEDAGTPTGDIAVRAYIEIDDQIEDTRQKLEQALFYLGMIQPIPAPAYRVIQDQNWMEAWKKRYQPIAIGERTMIVPVWMESPDPNRVSIRIDPGMAFGTGTHPTTQLCLQLMESVYDQPKQFITPNQVIDIGCGSGILSVGAIKLGSSFALGVDIDQASVDNSRENAENNAISASQFEIGLGSVQEVLNGQFSISRAPLVLANILAPVLIRLFDANMKALIADGGAIILSGILEHPESAVRAKAEEKGLTFVAQAQIQDWVALLFKNR